jgi:hypothetical protein
MVSCSGISSGSAQNTAPPPPPPTGAVIPSSFFGMIVNKLSSYLLQLPYGQWRGWDSGEAQWPQTERCEAQSGQPSDPCFTWTNLDTELANIHASGMKDVLLTVSRSPQWAVNLASDPTGQNGTDCNFYQPNPSSPEEAPDSVWLRSISMRTEAEPTRSGRTGLPLLPPTSTTRCPVRPKLLANGNPPHLRGHRIQRAHAVQQGLGGSVRSGASSLGQCDDWRQSHFA